MIKTILRDEALTQALARHQAWVDTHTDQTAVQALEAHRRAKALALVTLTAENTALRAKLRMAKASLPGKAH